MTDVPPLFGRTELHKQNVPKPQTAWAVWTSQQGWMRDFNGGIVLFRYKRDAQAYPDAIKVIVTPADSGDSANG
jgi:hypothetical protein